MLYKLQIAGKLVYIHMYIQLTSKPYKMKIASSIFYVTEQNHSRSHSSYISPFSCILSLFIVHCIAHRMINQAAWRTQCCQQDPSCTAGFLWQFCNVPMTQHACWCQDSEYGPAHCFHSQTWKAEKMMLEGASIYGVIKPQKLMRVQEGPATSWVFSRIVTNFLYWIFESS